MFTSYKCARIFSRKVRFKNLLKPSPCYFSQENNSFVKKVRDLESVKLTGTFSSVCEKAKYILFLRRDYVCVDRNKLAFRDFKDVQDLRKLGNVVTAFLDVLNDSGSEVYLFAADLQIAPDDLIEKINKDGKFVPCRRSIFFLSDYEAQLLHHARGLLHFYESYQFCSQCGTSLQVNEGGYLKLCPNCKSIHYPQVSPIGITLIEDSEHKEVLLVRQHSHLPGMFTCVAGFIEPGESLEQNAKREAAEEVGLTISNVEYCISQHWSAPSSQLVLGCTGTALSKNQSIDGREITASKWVTAEELKDAVTEMRRVKNADAFKGHKFWAPAVNTVSHRLMVIWLTKYHNFKPCQ